MRRISDQKPEQILTLLRNFVAKVNPETHVEGEGMLHHNKNSITNRYTDDVREAVKEGFRKDTVFIREGGSVGVISMIAKQWNVPILFLGRSLPEHGYRTPNERFDYGQAMGSIQAFVFYFSKLSNVPRLRQPYHPRSPNPNPIHTSSRKRRTSENETPANVV